MGSFIIAERSRKLGMQDVGVSHDPAIYCVALASDFTPVSFTALCIEWG